MTLKKNLAVALTAVLLAVGLTSCALDTQSGSQPTQTPPVVTDPPVVFLEGHPTNEVREVWANFAGEAHIDELLSDLGSHLSEDVTWGAKTYDGAASDEEELVVWSNTPLYDEMLEALERMKKNGWETYSENIATYTFSTLLTKDNWWVTVVVSPDNWEASLYEGPTQINVFYYVPEEG